MSCSLSLLALLAALALLARVREVPARLLKTRRRGREVTVDVDVLVRGLERLTQAVEGFLRGPVVAAGQALDRVAQRLARGTRRLARLRLELGQLRGEIPLLLVAHAGEVVAGLMQILARLRWVTVRVLLRVARGGARERSRQRRERRRPLFVRRVQLGPNVAFERAHAGEVQVEVARPLAEPLRELAKILGDLRTGVGRSTPLPSRSFATSSMRCA